MPITAHLLSKAAHSAPSADNSQPWRLIWQDNTLTVKYAIQRVRSRTFPAISHAMLLTIGALSENLTQASIAMNVKLDFNWSTSINETDPVYFQAKILQTDTLPVQPIENLPLFKRHTNRHPYQKTPLPTECKAMLNNLTQKNTRLVIIEDKTCIHEIARLVKQASEIRFQTKEVHEWLAKSFRFNTNANDQYGEGLDVNTIDLPPGGRLFLQLISSWQRMNWLNKLGMYKIMSMIDSQPVSTAPALIAIIGPDDIPEDNIAAGQLMNRAWIALNEAGIAAHPYYVMTDQLQRRKLNSVSSQLSSKVDSLSTQIQQLFGLQANETVHMLFRVGYPKQTPVKSKRLPLKEVCSGILFEE